MFVYAGLGLGAGIGGLTALSQLAATIGGVVRVVEKLQSLLDVCIVVTTIRCLQCGDHE
jgi:hypothetical protein